MLCCHAPSYHAYRMEVQIAHLSGYRGRLGTVCLLLHHSSLSAHYPGIASLHHSPGRGIQMDDINILIENHVITSVQVNVKSFRPDTAGLLPLSAVSVSSCHDIKFSITFTGN